MSFSATTLVVELLIIGLQTSAAAVFIVLAILNQRTLPTHTLSDFKDWSALIALFIVGIVYTLGIIIDRAASALFWLIRDSGRDPTPTDQTTASSPPPQGDQGPGHTQMRITVLAESDALAQFVEDVRRRRRIIRATVLNLGLIIVAILIFQGVGAVRGSPTFPAPVAISVLAVAVVLLGTSIGGEMNLDYLYDKNLRQAYDHVCTKTQGRGSTTETTAG